MEWRDALRIFRKAFDNHLRKQGFRFKNGVWRRDGAFWQYEFSIEVTPSKRTARKVMAFPCLSQCILIEGDAETKAASPYLTGFDTFQHHTLRFKPDGHGDVIVQDPEELGPLAESWLRAFDRDWLPWMEARDTSDRTGAYSYVEHRHTSLRGVEI